MHCILSNVTADDEQALLKADNEFGIWNLT